MDSIKALINAQRKVNNETYKDMVKSYIEQAKKALEEALKTNPDLADSNFISIPIKSIDFANSTIETDTNTSSWLLSNVGLVESVVFFKDHESRRNGFCSNSIQLLYQKFEKAGFVVYFQADGNFPSSMYPFIHV